MRGWRCEGRSPRRRRRRTRSRRIILSPTLFGAAASIVPPFPKNLTSFPPRPRPLGGGQRLRQTPFPTRAYSIHAMATRRSHTRPGAAVSSLSAGGGKGGAAANAWAALAADTDSDSETERPSSMDATVAAFRAAAAAFAATTPVKKAPVSAPVAPGAPVKAPLEEILADLHRGDRLWGDILCEGDVPVVATLSVTPPPLPARPRANTEEDLWAQPWAARLSEHFCDCYDTRALTDAEWEAMLTWLYAEGWEVQDYDRESVKAYQDDAPPRIWVRPPPEEDAPAARGLHGKFRGIAEADATEHHDCDCHHHAPAAPLKTLEGRKATIPRFCRAGAECADLECRFVHADTIPRINEPCKFGAECGASDPTGLKRSQCLRMHPDETWTAEMVIVRPPPAPAAAAAAAETTA